MASDLGHLWALASSVPDARSSSGFDGAFGHDVVRCRKVCLTETCRIARDIDLPMACRTFRPGNLSEQVQFF